MARNTNIKLRRSATAGAIPTTSNLDLGEIAIIPMMVNFMRKQPKVQQVKLFRLVQPQILIIR